MTDRTMDRWRRRGGAALAAATVGAGGLMFVPMAEAALPPAQSTAEVCVEVAAGASGFTDISGNTHQASIECVAAADIARGTSPTIFNPGGIVSRGQMASFIARAIDVANEQQLVEIPDLPASPTDQFRDDDGNTHEANINRLAAAGIVNGKSATAFDPDAAVSRSQMATFIANTQVFLSGGSAPFGSSEDFFTDDETNVHEANINAIAAGGVAQGVDGVRYQPNAPVLRSQMTTFLARYLGVLEAADIIAPINGEGTSEPPPPASNATISFGPTSEQRVLAAVEPSSSDDRTYTATGLDSAKKYRVTLFDLNSISITAGPVFTFTEDGATGFATPGSVGQARIAKVNGTEAAEAAQSIGSIAPVDGKVVVDVDGVNYARLVPVIFEDSADDQTNLNLDGQDQPSEPFGVGGVLEVIPLEAGAGALTADEMVLLADEDLDIIVAGSVGSAANHTYAYDANDEFYLDEPTPANEVTSAVFEQSLNRGDMLLAGTEYAADANGVSKFVLGNTSPKAPTPVVQAVGARSAVIRVNGVLLGAQVNVHVGADGASFAKSPLKVSVTEDALPSVPGFQVGITGLSPSTKYEFYVTQTDDGETSAPHAAAPGEATALDTTGLTPPTITGAAFTGGTRPSDKVVIDFSEAVTPTDAAASKVKVLCVTEPGLIPILQPGKTVTYSTTELVQTDGDTLTATLNASVPNDSADCKVQLAKDTVFDVDQTGNAVAERALA